jgi:oligoribonuclease
MAASKRSKSRLVWIDCEMTGLDPERDHLIEIATLITDNRLKVVAEGPVLAIHQPERVLARMNAWNRRTHGGSGLLERVRASEVDVAEAEKATLRFLRRHCYKNTAPLCGNSVCQDRRFLARYMPRVNDFLHYRMVDVSTIKELVQRWYRKECGPPKKAETHTALSDIRESIEELRHYRETVFVQTGRKVRGQGRGTTT